MRSPPTTPPSKPTCSPPRRGSARRTLACGLSTRRGLASSALIVLSVAMREKYFERRQIKEAIAFAEEGGIAIHRNFDSYHGSTIRGFRRERPFLHVIGLRPPSKSGAGFTGFGRSGFSLKSGAPSPTTTSLGRRLK